MEPLDVAALYYDAWKNKNGDMTEVPLAEDFSYIGPVASFEDAAGFRAMAASAGPLVTGFAIRHQAVLDDVVLTVVDMDMSLPIPTVTSAEILEIRDGQIVRGENVYDAEPMRRAMAQGPAEA
ncbi:MAG: nuclear transport factor 2 family protein [Solirubrobacteraceae bacterium]